MKLIKIVLVLMMVLISLSTIGTAATTDFNFEKELTITTSTGNPELTNFPALLHIADGSDTTTGTGTIYINWVDLKESNGADFRVFDSDKTTLLDYEFESWDDTNKEAWVWVRIPTMSRTGTDTIYIAYGKEGATDAQDPSEVWTRTTHSVFHLNDPENSVIVNKTYKFASNGAQYGNVDPTSPGKISIPVNVINRPSAIYNESQDKTYIVWQDTSYSPHIIYYDHSTNSFSSAVNIGGTTLTDDSHGSPAITIDDSGYLYVFYGSHVSAQYWKKSTSPYDITAWGTEQSITGHEYTYPQVWNYNGDLKLFLRDRPLGNYNDCPIIMRTYNGVSWSAETTIVDFTITNRIYALTHMDDSGTIHMFFSKGDSADTLREDVYYAKSEDGGSTWKKSDDTTYTLPITETTGEKIYDSNSNWAHTVTGDIQTDSTGNPMCLFVTDDSELKYKLIKYNGSSWNTYSIASADQKWDSANLIIDSNTNYRTYLAMSSGGERGGQRQEYISTDGGQTWAYNQTIGHFHTAHSMTVYNMNSDGELETIFGGGYEYGDVHAYGESIPITNNKINSVTYGTPTSINGFGGGYRFDGNDYFDITKLGLFGWKLDKWSVVFTLNTTDTTSMAPLGSANDGTTTCFIPILNQDSTGGLNGGYVRVYERDQDNTALSGATNSNINFNDGTPHRLVITANGGSNQIHVYKDGDTKTITYSLQQAPDNFIQLQYPVFLGANNGRGTADNFLDGELYDLQIFTNTLSSDWVTADYEQFEYTLFSQSASTENQIDGPTIDIYITTNGNPLTSAVVNDEDYTGGFMNEYGSKSLTPNSNPDKIYPVSVTGDLGEGFILQMTADGASVTAVPLTINNLVESRNYDIYLDNQFIERIGEVSSYTYNFTSFSTHTLKVDYVTGSSDSNTGSTTASGAIETDSVTDGSTPQTSDNDKTVTVQVNPNLWKLILLICLLGLIREGSRKEGNGMIIAISLLGIVTSAYKIGFIH